MMIMKLDYIFASLLLHFVLGEVELKNYFLYISLDRRVGLKLIFI